MKNNQSAIIDNIEMNKIYKNFEIEKTNYSYYKPNLTIEVDKYISENGEYLSILLVKSSMGETTLLIAPTGSGKTYSIIEMLKENSEVTDNKYIFVLPNSMNVEQVMKEYKIYGAYGDISITEPLECGKVLALTWDKFIQIDKNLLDDYIIVLDEVHQIYSDMSFRGKKINLLTESLIHAKGQIHITATPNKLDFKEYNFILEYKQKIQTDYNIKLYSKVCDKTILDIINNSKKFSLFRNDTKYLEFIKHNTNKKADIITSNIKEISKTYKNIIEHGSIGEVEGLLNTSVLVAGVNIYDKDVTDIILVGMKDIASIKQYIARFRDLESVNVHIFNEYEETSETFSIENYIDYRINKTSILIDFHNDYYISNKYEDKDLYLDIKPVRLENSLEYYYNSELNRYFVSETGIRYLCYNSYYKKASIESFKVLLGEYFNNIDIVKIDKVDNKALKDYKKLSKDEKDELIKELETIKIEIVGAIEVLKGNVSSETEGYLNLMNMDISKYKDYLVENELDKKLLNSSISSIVSRYSSYIVKNGYNYDLAWNIANKGNLARGKFFNQIRYIIYREVENKYPNLLKHDRLEDKLYLQIKERFKIGKSYTNEHLELFCESINSIYPLMNLNSKKLGMILNDLFIIEASRVRNVHQVEFIFSIYNSSTSCTNDTDNKKPTKIHTIKDNMNLDYIVEQNNLDDLSKKILQQKIDDKLESIDEKASEIEIERFCI